MFDMTPYPDGEERGRINAAFDNLFNTIEEKVNEDGKHVLFRIAGLTDNQVKAIAFAEGKTEEEVRQELDGDKTVRFSIKDRKKITSVNDSLAQSHDEKIYGGSTQSIKGAPSSTAQNSTADNNDNFKSDDTRFRFGGNKGYVGYSKSVRAVDAENRGLRNKSQMDSEFADEVNELIKEAGNDTKPVSLSTIKKCLKYIDADEWHHTSKFGNKTNYWSAQTVANFFTDGGEQRIQGIADRERGGRLLLDNLVKAQQDMWSFITDNHLMKEGRLDLSGVPEEIRSEYERLVAAEKKASDKYQAFNMDVESGTRFRLTEIAPEVRAEMDDIVRKAKADDTYMKAPNGKPTNLNEEQWALVRTQSFKKWFNDWELASLLNMANRAWTDKQFKQTFRFSPSKKAATKFEELLGHSVNTLLITADVVRHIKERHGSNESKRGQIDMTPEDIVIIPYVINNYDSMELSPDHNDKMGNKAIEIRKRINGTSVVAAIEKGKDKSVVLSGWKKIKSDALDAESSTPGLYVRNDSDITNVNKDIQNIKSSAKKSSKIVDENGEPKPVWHGTNWKMSPDGLTFDESRVGQNVDAVDIDDNLFFTASEDAAKGYGDAYSFFLNISNPRRLVIPMSSDEKLPDAETAHEMIVEAHDGDSDYIETDNPKDKDGSVWTIGIYDAKAEDEYYKTEIVKLEKRLADKYGDLDFARAGLKDERKTLDKEDGALRKEAADQLKSKVYSMTDTQAKTVVGSLVLESLAGLPKLDASLRNKLKSLDRRMKELGQKELDLDPLIARLSIPRFEPKEFFSYHHVADMFSLDKPGQIKSATDNNGEFSENNNSTLFRMQPQELREIQLSFNFDEQKELKKGKDDGFKQNPDDKLQDDKKNTTFAPETTKNQDNGGSDNLQRQSGGTESGRFDTGRRGTEVSANTAENPVLKPLRKLKPGETCLVERRFSESGEFSFVGKNKVESIEDVAYIFRQLENKAIENVFVAFVKDGRTHVIHVGMGGIDISFADRTPVAMMMKNINPDKVYLIHNHPSGNVVASGADMNLWDSLHAAVGDKLQDGIIIDTNRGVYGTFRHDTNDMQRFLFTQTDAENAEIKIPVYRFDTQVFSRDYDPQSLVKGTSSTAIAAYAASHRLGERDKMSVLCLSSSCDIIGNFFLPYSSMPSIEVGDNIVKACAYYLSATDTRRAVLYGSALADHGPVMARAVGMDSVK